MAKYSAPKLASRERLLKARASTRTTYQLGDLISVAFEQALTVTKDHNQAAQLASLVVERLLARDVGHRHVAQLAAI